MSVAELGCQPRQTDCGSFAHRQHCPFSHPRAIRLHTRVTAEYISQLPTSFLPSMSSPLGSGLVTSGCITHALCLQCTPISPTSKLHREGLRCPEPCGVSCLPFLHSPSFFSSQNAPHLSTWSVAGSFLSLRSQLELSPPWRILTPPHLVVPPLFLFPFPLCIRCNFKHIFSLLFVQCLLLIEP